MDPPVRPRQWLVDRLPRQRSELVLVHWALDGGSLHDSRTGHACGKRPGLGWAAMCSAGMRPDRSKVL